MKRQNKWLLAFGAIFVTLVGCLFFCGIPRFGDKPALKPEIPVAVQVKWFDVERRVSDSGICAEIADILCNARGGGPSCACVCLGGFSLQYADGSTAQLHIQPGHWLRRTDVLHDGHRYSIASSELYRALERMGIHLNSK